MLNKDGQLILADDAKILYSYDNLHGRWCFVVRVQDSALTFDYYRCEGYIQDGIVILVSKGRREQIGKIDDKDNPDWLYIGTEVAAHIRKQIAVSRPFSCTTEEIIK